MSGTAKIGILGLLATVIGVLVYQGTKTVSAWAGKISVTFSSIGKPQLRLGKLSVPINLVVQNPTPLVAPIDNLKVRLIKNNVVFGESDNTGPFQIKEGSNPLTLFTQVVLNKVLPDKTNLLTQVSNVLSNQSPAIQFIIEATITIQGFSLVKTEPKTLYLNDLLNAR